jgi:hypothetical protein
MPRKKKQTEIPGTERQRDDEIALAAEDLRDVRARRMALSEEETAAADRLIDLLRKKKRDVYVDEEGGYRVALKPGRTRVSVTTLRDDDDSEDAEAAE